MKLINPSQFFGKKNAFMSVASSMTSQDSNPTWHLVLGSRKLATPDKIEELFGGRLDRQLSEDRILEFSDRWSKKGLKAFLKGARQPTFAETYSQIDEMLRGFLEFQNETSFHILSLYIVFTYLYSLFPALPYLVLQGPKGSGKTRVLEILECLALNPLLMGNVTDSALVRSCGNPSGTMLLDEMEDPSQECLRILNVGYKERAGKVLKTKSDKSVEVFDVYGPKVIAAIGMLNPTTKSRAIVIRTIPSRKPEITRARLDQRQKEIVAIRDALYGTTLCRWKEIVNAQQEEHLFRNLCARDFEVYRPLLSIASVVDAQDKNLNVVDSLHSYIDVASKQERAAPEEIYYLLKLLSEELPKEGFCELRTSDIALELSHKLDEPISPKIMNQLMQSLGFKYQRKSKGTFFKIKRAQVDDLAARYSVK